MTTTPTLPPPLSAPPTVATLQGLLDGLQQPMHRGVPSPPTPERLFGTARTAAAPTSLDDGAVLAVTRPERFAASQQAVEPPQRPASAAPEARPGPRRRPAPMEHPTPVLTRSLTWSAGRDHHHSRRTAALGAVAAAAAAVTVTALITAGELALP